MLPDEIVEFERLEKVQRHNPAVIQAMERTLESIVAKGPAIDHYSKWVLYRNLFRVRNAQHLLIKKPRVFLGMIGYMDYPNFQVWPLLLNSDVVSLCKPEEFDGRADRISYDFRTEAFSDLVDKLPAHFIPDYFWDPQACGLSVPPYGIEEAPFPTAAGLCHTFRGPHMEALADYYDYVAPLSAPFSDIFRSADVSAEVIDVPLGGNWSAFNSYYIANRSAPRKIDLLVNFSPSSGPEYGHYRELTHRLCNQFKQKYDSRFTILFQFGVEKSQYLETMLQARVVVNACGYNGPYNYRSFEAINCGALLMQIDTVYDVPQSLSTALTEGEHYLSFDEENFESKLLTILQDEPRRNEIAQAAFDKLSADFSCEKIQRQLADCVKPTNIQCRPRKDGFESLQTWMSVLATSPIHYRHKRKLFASMAINSGTEDPLSIRYTLMALPILANTEMGSSYINDSALRAKFDLSVMESIDYVYGLLDESEVDVLFRWFYCCMQAIYGHADDYAMDTLCIELKQPETMSKLSLVKAQQVLLDLDVADKKFIHLKKTLYDMPTMTHLDNLQARQASLCEFLLESVGYFKSLNAGNCVSLTRENQHYPPSQDLIKQTGTG